MSTSPALKITSHGYRTIKMFKPWKAMRISDITKTFLSNRIFIFDCDFASL